MASTTERRTSWLFDRLTELASAERLSIYVDAAFADQLLHVLHRAALLPDTIVRFGHPFGDDDPGAGSTRFVASAESSAADVFARLTSRDMGVAVGALATGATMKVGDAGDVGSVLDALLTLRMYAQRGEGAAPR